MSVTFLKKTLRKLAQLMIWRYRPGIIGVTGSAGKSSTKMAIAAVLGRARRVRVSPGNLNSDLGLPLTILGDWSEEDLALVSRATPPGTKRFQKMMFWLKVIVVSLWRIAFPGKNYPEILILEYGADHPGDIKALLQIARPNVSVITAIGTVPVHVENYSGPEEVAREKGRLIEFLPVGGFAVLNGDDQVVSNLQSRTRARVMKYGFEKGAEVRASRFEHKISPEGMPLGILFKIENGSSIVPVRIEGVLGRANAYAATAAATVGVVFGMNLVAISEALADYVPPDSRMQLVPGKKGTLVIDDSYNASPIAMRSALDTLATIPAKRKVAVLGDMLEIGKYAPEAHEAVGRQVAECADALFTVGPRAKFIAEAAKEEGMKRTMIFSFDMANDAKRAVQDFIKKGDLILVKGSHAMELDKIVEEIKDQTPVVSPV